MDRKKTNLMKIYSQPAFKKLSTNKLSINKISCSQNQIKLKNNNDTNITNFYQQKKRILLNNDSFEESNSRSPFKKQRKIDDDNTPIIGWDKASNLDKNLNVDCQLKVEPSIETSIHKEDQINLNSNNNTNEVKIDQMLNEFHAKLQFNCLSKFDSGNNSDYDTMNSDFTLSNAPDEIKKIENLVMQQKSNYSKESGISSCNSINQDINSPIIINKEYANKEQDKFKIPKTPKTPIRNLKSEIVDKSVQFFSTPKLITKQNKKLNQTLNFKDISPIKGNSNDNILININTDNKRQFNDSNEEDLSSKKRNGKILFENNKSKINNKKNDFDFEDDSFDLILSQAISKIDDNELLNKKPNNQLNTPKQLNIQKNQQLKLNQFNSKSQSTTNDNKQLKVSNGLKNGSQSSNTNNRISSYKTNSIKSVRSSYSNNTNSIKSTPSSYSNNTKSILTTKSSIQFSDDSSNLFVTTNRKSLNNQPLNEIKQSKKMEDSMDACFDEDEDVICTQLVVNI